MLHSCIQRFDMTKNLKKFYKILGTKPSFSPLGYDLVNGMNRRLRAGVVFKVDFMDGRDDFLHLSSLP